MALTEALRDSSTEPRFCWSVMRGYIAFQVIENMLLAPHLK